jgi:hypothetical protein
MTRLTMGEAAKAGWGSRASLYRLAKAGKLSTTVDGDRQLVDVAELVRVLGEPRAQRKRDAEDLVASPDRDARIELERRVAELEAEKVATAAELRIERAAARDAAAAAAAERERLMATTEWMQRKVDEAQKLLADARATTARSWWQKLLGRPAVLGVVALLLAAGDARARMRTGNDALQPCRAHEMSYGARDLVDAYDQGICIGTVGGLFYVGPNLHPEHRFCPPNGANHGQALRIALAYMERNPARLHVDFQKLVIDALREAWPCRR